MFPRIMRWLAAALFITAIAPTITTGAQGPATTGPGELSEVSGKVTDTSGVVIAPAEVLFDCGGTIVKTLTTEKGFAVKLRSGSCSVTVQAQGFDSKTIADVRIHAPYPIVISLRLEVYRSEIVDGVVSNQREIEPIPSELPFADIEKIPEDSRVPLEPRKAQSGVVRTTICEVVSKPRFFEGKTIELRANVLAGLETNTRTTRTVCRDNCQPESCLSPMNKGSRELVTTDGFGVS